MSFYCLVHATTVVTTRDHKALMSAWASYGNLGLVGTFRCEFSPTKSQLSRMPGELRSRLSVQEPARLEA